MHDDHMRMEFMARQRFETLMKDQLHYFCFRLITYRIGRSTIIKVLGKGLSQILRMAYFNCTVSHMQSSWSRSLCSRLSSWNAIWGWVFKAWYILKQKFSSHRTLYGFHHCIEVCVWCMHSKPFMLHQLEDDAMKEVKYKPACWKKLQENCCYHCSWFDYF